MQASTSVAVSNSSAVFRWPSGERYVQRRSFSVFRTARMCLIRSPATTNTIPRTGGRPQPGAVKGEGNGFDPV